MHNPHEAQPVVFPMHMGVYRSRPINSIYRYCIPHAYGGVPTIDKNAQSQMTYSPCIWGCTALFHPLTRINESIPHAYGGVPWWLEIKS